MRKLYNRKLKRVFVVKEIKLRDNKHIDVICYSGRFGMYSCFRYPTFKVFCETWLDAEESS